MAPYKRGRSNKRPMKRPVSRASIRGSAARKPYKRPARAAPARKRRTNVVNASGTKHLSVRMNPFSQATQQPKIPDGKLTSSLSRRLNSVFELKNGSGSIGPDIMHLFYAPTLGVPLVAINSAEGVQLRSGSAYDPSFHGFTGQTIGCNVVTSAAPTTPIYPLSAGADHKLLNTGGFSKWRVVSQGLHLDLVNNQEENDGWFEACRFNWGRGNDQLCITPLDGGKTSTACGVAPAHQVYSQHGSMSMVEQPGYAKGALRDIGKYQFNLHPQSVDHEAIDISPAIQLTDPADIDTDTNAATLSLVEGQTNASQIKEQYVDTNMDWLYIRLHCRPNNTGNTLGSRFMCHMSQNLEMAFEPTSDLATFQTINVLDSRNAGVADGLNNNPAAMEMRR